MAPFNRDSGQQSGKRAILSGRRAVRSGLYMAGLVASRHNPILRPFYERLRAAGKPPKLALTGVTRKLLVASTVHSNPNHFPFDTPRQLLRAAVLPRFHVTRSGFKNV
jgi:transposase